MRVAVYRACGRISILEGDDAFIDLNVSRLPAGDERRSLDGTRFAAAATPDLPNSAAAFDAASAA